MLEPWRPSVEVECGDCQETTWLGQHDPAVVGDVVDGRIVVRVHGEAAVSRIFPMVPDTVTMSRSRPGTDDDQQLSLAVEHREP